MTCNKITIDNQKLRAFSFQICTQSFKKGAREIQSKTISFYCRSATFHMTKEKRVAAVQKHVSPLSAARTAREVNPWAQKVE